MEIRFCDLCNESVPVSDFATGTAITRKGKVICAACDRAMGGGHRDSASGVGTLTPVQAAPSAKRGKLQAGAPPAMTAQATSTQPSPHAGSQPVDSLGHPAADAPSHQKSRAGAAALFVAVGGLAALGTGGLMLAERLDGVESSVQASGFRTTASIDQLRAERAGLMAPIQGKIDEAAAAAGAAASNVRSETTTEIAALHARLENAESRSMELRSALDAVRQELVVARAEAQTGLQNRDSEVASLQKVVQFHGDSLVEIRERIREAGALVAAGQTAAGAAGAQPGTPGLGGAAGPAAGPAAAAAWASLIPDLSNPDEALRLTAVLELGETGDPAVSEFIMPLLKDTDSFVRMVSVQALGDLGYKPAVPHLIDSLSDDRWTVREAARDALRTITGKNFGFDPTVREAEMKKKIDQWRSWWRREGDDFLTK
jgi:hypothetical protein